MDLLRIFPLFVTPKLSAINEIANLRCLNDVTNRGLTYVSSVDPVIPRDRDTT